MRPILRRKKCVLNRCDELQEEKNVYGVFDLFVCRCLQLYFGCNINIYLYRLLTLPATIDQSDGLLRPGVVPIIRQQVVKRLSPLSPTQS